MKKVELVEAVAAEAARKEAVAKARELRNADK